MDSTSSLAAEMQAARARALAIAAEASEEEVVGESDEEPSPRLDLSTIGRVETSSKEQDEARLELMRYLADLQKRHPDPTSSPAPKKEKEPLSPKKIAEPVAQTAVESPEEKSVDTAESKNPKKKWGDVMTKLQKELETPVNIEEDDFVEETKPFDKWTEEDEEINMGKIDKLEAFLSALEKNEKSSNAKSGTEPPVSGRSANTARKKKKKTKKETKVAKEASEQLPDKPVPSSQVEEMNTFLTALNEKSRYIDKVLANHSEHSVFSLVPVSESEDNGSGGDKKNLTEEELQSVRLVSKPGFGFMPSSTDLDKLGDIDSSLSVMESPMALVTFDNIPSKQADDRGSWLLDMLRNGNAKERENAMKNPFSEDLASINSIDARLQQLSKEGKSKQTSQKISKLSKKLLKKDPMLLENKLEPSLMQKLLSNPHATTNGWMLPESSGARSPKKAAPKRYSKEYMETGVRLLKEKETNAKEPLRQEVASLMKQLKSLLNKDQGESLMSPRVRTPSQSEPSSPPSPSLSSASASVGNKASHRTYDDLLTTASKDLVMSKILPAFSKGIGMKTKKKKKNPSAKKGAEDRFSDDDDLGIVGDLEEEMLQFGHKVDNSREAGAILLSGRAGANARSRRHVNKIATLERPGSCAGSRAGSRPGSALRVRNGRPSLAKEAKPILSKSSSFLPLVSHRGGSVLDGNELLPSGKTFRGGAGKNPQDENESVRMVYPWRPGSGSGTRPASAEMQLLLAAQRDRERSKRAASKDPRPKSSHDGLFSKGVMDPPPPRPLSGKLVQNFRKAVRQTSLSKGPGGRPVKKFLKPVTPRTGREGRAKKQAPRSTG